MNKDRIDFDEVIDRKNTNSIKYDFAAQRGKPEDILPLWVADMDFKAPEPVLKAMEKCVSHGIFGYSEPKEAYFDAVKFWMQKNHNWKVERSWLIKTPGVVFALATAVKAYTNPGDGILIQQPVYYPFAQVIRDNNRTIIHNDLYLGEDKRYHMDLEDLENKVRDNRVKLMFLCNPQNPVGRVWSKEELIELGKIVCRYNLIVVSDEIHEDFVFKGRHQVFAGISEELKNRTITCTAPSKTFNIAGLQISNLFLPNPDLRRRFKKEMDATGYSQLNTLGLVACEAAYRHGREWHNQLLNYLNENINYVRKFLVERIQRVKLIEPEGTYLLWLDFRELGLTEEAREELIVKQAGLWLDSGGMFGPSGEGFERMNIACPRSVLTTALVKLETAIKSNKNY